AAEARFIAEDLVAREPWDRSNIERFRRALELLGEPDPEALIAERLSGQSPFMTTDLFFEENDFPPSPVDDAPQAPEPTATAASGPPPISPVSEAEPESLVEPRSVETRAAGPASKPPAHDQSSFGNSAYSIDLEGILEELESPPAVAHASSESVEVDLSIVLDDIKRPQRRPEMPGAVGAPAEPAPAAPAAPADLDGVFAHLREGPSRRTAMEEAEQQYKRGL